MFETNQFKSLPIQANVKGICHEIMYAKFCLLINIVHVKNPERASTNQEVVYHTKFIQINTEVCENMSCMNAKVSYFSHHHNLG